MTKKLLYVVTEDHYFLSHRFPLAVEAQRQGYQVGIACRLSQHKETFIQAGFEVFEVPFRRGNTNPVYEWQAFWKLGLIYRHWRPQVVHHVAFKPILYGTIWARLWRVEKIINAVAGLGIFAGPDHGFLKRLTLSLASLVLRSKRVSVIVQNHEDGQVMQRCLPASQIHLIPGAGVDMRVFYPAAVCPERPTFTVMMASRLLWTKGVGQLVQASGILHQQGLACQVWVAGMPDTQNPDHVPTLSLSRWHDEGVFQWLERREDIADLYRQADVAILPSYYGEGIPKTLIEALACGKPIITTDHPGCRDVIKGPYQTHGSFLVGLNGILVPPQQAQPLADAITYLQSNPSLRQAMGLASRELACEVFDAQHIHTQTVACYEK